MNKGDLIRALEGRLGSRKAATDALEAVVDVIIREVARGNSVGITGFGTFEKTPRAARTGRNPRTGETVRIKKTNVPRFRPGTAFKGYVARPSTLPKAGVPIASRASASTSASGTKATSAKAGTAGTATPAKATKATSAKAGTATKAKAKATKAARTTT